MMRPTADKKDQILSEATHLSGRHGGRVRHGLHPMEKCQGNTDRPIDVLKNDIPIYVRCLTIKQGDIR